MSGIASLDWRRFQRKWALTSVESRVVACQGPAQVFLLPTKQAFMRPASEVLTNIEAESEKAV
jgi:hypothetical protein